MSLLNIMKLLEIFRSVIEAKLCISLDRMFSWLDGKTNTAVPWLQTTYPDAWGLVKAKIYHTVTQIILLLYTIRTKEYLVIMCRHSKQTKLNEVLIRVQSMIIETNHKIILILSFFSFSNRSSWKLNVVWTQAAIRSFLISKDKHEQDSEAHFDKY